MKIYKIFNNRILNAASWLLIIGFWLAVIVLVKQDEKVCKHVATPVLCDK